MSNPIRDAFDLILPPEQRARRMTGQVVDGYVIHEMIEGGEGGFGVVYRAEHPEMGRAAIKVLAVDVEENSKAYARFMREVRLLCEMRKVQNVVNICHAGVIDNLPWYAMEYIEGMTLARWIESTRQSGGPSLEQIVWVLRGVLKGLEQVQEEICDGTSGNKERQQENLGQQCVVHRDIKPGNVMIVNGGNDASAVRLIDFGIAGLFSTGKTSQTPLTRESLFSLTPEYSSPEMHYSSDSLDIRSDIFQVGLLGYEMITGKRYWGHWPAIDDRFSQKYSVKDRIWEPCIETDEKNPWPQWLIRTIVRAVAWNREDRFASPQEFLVELEKKRPQSRHKIMPIRGKPGRIASDWQRTELSDDCWLLKQLIHDGAPQFHIIRAEEEESWAVVRKPTKISRQALVALAGSESALCVEKAGRQMGLLPKHPLQKAALTFATIGMVVLGVWAGMERNARYETRTRQEKMTDIRDGYDQLKKVQEVMLQDNLMDLHSKCSEYIRLYPKEAQYGVDRLYRWLDDILKNGEVCLTAKNIVNYSPRHKEFRLKITKATLNSPSNEVLLDKKYDIPYTGFPCDPYQCREHCKVRWDAKGLLRIELDVSDGSKYKTEWKFSDMIYSSVQEGYLCPRDSSGYKFDGKIELSSGPLPPRP